MAGFVHYADCALELEQAIGRAGLALHIDWTNARDLHEVARESIDWQLGLTHATPASRLIEREHQTLCGLVMLRLHIETDLDPQFQPGPVWLALAPALVDEFAALQQAGPVPMA